MLLHTIELRQAPWLWIHNLAAPDPLHILPVFFIVTMFLVQYLTPSPGMDPAQQKMMAFTMPVFFGFHDMEPEFGARPVLGVRQRN